MMLDDNMAQDMLLYAKLINFGTIKHKVNKRSSILYYYRQTITLKLQFIISMVKNQYHLYMFWLLVTIYCSETYNSMQFNLNTLRDVSIKIVKVSKLLTSVNSSIHVFLSKYIYIYFLL